MIRNALRHGAKAGPVTVEAARTGEEVTITVSDLGPGVAQEELPKIFEPFYRADASRTRETGGTGLGLTIVKACVQSCGGSVAARNREPGGFEVQIRLGAAEEPAAAEKAVVPDGS